MNSNWSYGPETAKWGHDLCDLDLWPLTLTFLMDITFVIGNNSWKFHDDTMMGTLSKRCHRRTDGQTDRQTDGQTEIAILKAWSQLKRRQAHNYETIQADYIQTAKCKATYGKRRVHYISATKWNNLEETVKTMKLSAFKIAVTEQKNRSV